MYTPNNYGNGFYNVGAPIAPQQFVSQQPQNTFAWIKGGEETANNYPLAPGNTIVLIDSDLSVMYIKSSDLSGRPQPMQIYHLVSKSEHEKIQNGNNNKVYITQEDLEARLKELDNRYVFRKGDRK